MDQGHGLQLEVVEQQRDDAIEARREEKDRSLCASQEDLWFSMWC